MLAALLCNFIDSGPPPTVIPPRGGDDAKRVHFRRHPPSPKAKKDKFLAFLEKRLPEIYQDLQGTSVKEEAAAVVHSVGALVPSPSLSAVTIDWTRVARELASVRSLLALWRSEQDRKRQDFDDEEVLLLGL